MGGCQTVPWIGILARSDRTNLAPCFRVRLEKRHPASDSTAKKYTLIGGTSPYGTYMALPPPPPPPPETLDNWLHFYLSEPPVLAKAAGCKSCFALTLISQTRHIHMWRNMLMNYLLLKYSESILAFQLQFGTYEAESEHFRWEKKNPISTSGFQDK